MQDKNFEVYNGYKEEVLSILNDSYNFYENHGMEKLAKTIKNNIDTINSGEFEVVVVGEFSTGKSTFLNALMREKYLPSYTKETTATINYLRHASESEHPGIAYFFDKHTENLPSLDNDVVAKYVSTKNKEMNVQENIEQLDLFLDSPFLENKVTLIDSPGLNGMKQGLGEKTDAQIKKSHAVIFLFSAEQPGKRSEFEYLKKVKDQVDTVFLVLNKIDCIKESEGETVEDSIQGLIASYKDKFPDDTKLPEIIPVAAYPALVARSKQNLDYQNNFNISEDEKTKLEEMSRMAEFESKLLHFLTNSEKTVTQIKEPMQRLVKELSDSVSKYENEIKTLEGKIDGAELQEKISALESALGDLENKLNEQRGEIRKAVKQVERDTLEALDAELENVRKKCKANIDDLDSIETLSDDFNIFNKLLKRELNAVVTKLEQEFRDNFFDAVKEQYISFVNALEDELETTESAKIEFDSEIKVSANAIDAGIENFNAKKGDLENKMKALEEKMCALGVKEDELIEIAAEQERVKSKLERVQKSAEALASSFCPPEVVVTQKTGTRKVDRTGIFGGIADVILGKKTESYNYEERDDSERKEYISRRNAEKKELTDQIDKLESKLETVAGADKKLEITMSQRAAAQAELARLRDEEREFTARYDRELNEKYANEIARIKKSALAAVDSYIEDFCPEIKKALKDNRAKCTDTLQDLVEQNVLTQIEQKKKEYDNLINLKKIANNEKEAKLSEINELKGDATALKAKAEELLGRINSIEIDKVKYQDI